MKKSFVYIIIIMMLLTGCSQVGQFLPDGSAIELSTDSSDSSLDSPPESFDEVEAKLPEIENKAFSAKYEAETGKISGDLKLSQERKDYSGNGYITNFTLDIDNVFELSVNLPTNQHYDISIVAASKEKQRNILTINGTNISEFPISGNDKFEIITLRNVYIGKGTSIIGITEVTGGIDIDYISIKNSTAVSSITYTDKTELINKGANTKTKNTMKYLVSNFGKNTISGQYASIGANIEPELIYKTTGKYPAIRLSDFIGYTSASVTNVNETEESIKWASQGGLVSYVWHWEAPMNEASYYSDQTTFDLSKAVSKTNIALLPIEDIEKMYDKGEVSKECVEIIKDIDIISQQLKILQDNDVTVLWRPLHEAGGEWFWWGRSGKDAYKWLWKLLYERQTYYHKLNNLIWVWNAQNADWYVGDDLCDIISADIYASGNAGASQVNTYLELLKISKNKLLAISECDTPPDIDNMLRDKAVWSYFGIWSGNYIIGPDNNLSEVYTTKDRLISMYNHKNVITRDELPDLNTWGN